MNVREFIKKQREAKTKPSVNCIEGKQHQFIYACHADGRNSYVNYFTCEHCGEMIKEEHKRDQDDLMHWS